MNASLPPPSLELAQNHLCQSAVAAVTQMHGTDNMMVPLLMAQSANRRISVGISAETAPEELLQGCAAPVIATGSHRISLAYSRPEARGCGSCLVAMTADRDQDRLILATLPYSMDPSGGLAWSPNRKRTSTSLRPQPFKGETAVVQWLCRLLSGVQPARRPVTAFPVLEDVTRSIAHAKERISEIDGEPHTASFVVPSNRKDEDALRWCRLLKLGSRLS